MKIVFIQTGGTIDKDYPHTTKGWAFEFGEPATSRILERLNPSFEYEVLIAFQKDSLEITQEDREKLALLINKSKAQKFIITHGTDSLIETALFLKSALSNKLVVITAAMRPERFKNSDADVNLGGAIAAANLLEEGVYISMHGVLKEADEMQRNLETGKFY